MDGYVLFFSVDILHILCLLYISILNIPSEELINVD